MGRKKKKILHLKKFAEVLLTASSFYNYFKIISYTIFPLILAGGDSFFSFTPKVKGGNYLREAIISILLTINILFYFPLNQKKYHIKKLNVDI